MKVETSPLWSLNTAIGDFHKVTETTKLYRTPNKMIREHTKAKGNPEYRRSITVPYEINILV